MNVLLPIDDSDCCKKTQEWTFRYLDKYKARIYLLNVVTVIPVPTTTIATYGYETEAAETLVNTVRENFERRGFQVEEAVYLVGAPGQTICEYADEKNIDQIVIGSHGRQGLAGFLMGSVSREVYKHAKQPVLLLNTRGESSLEISHPDQTALSEYGKNDMKILLPVDGSDCCKKTLESVIRILNPEKTRIYLLNVYVPSTDTAVPMLGYYYETNISDSILDSFRRMLEDKGFRVVDASSLTGFPAESICNYADEKGTDQIMMGSHGHQGLTALLMGSVSQEVFERAKQPVIILKTGKHAAMKVSHIDQLHLSQNE